MIFTVNDATFEQRGIIDAAWTVRASGVTDLTLVQKGPLTADPTWPLYAPLTLKADADTIWQGWRVGTPRRVTGEEEAWQYQFRGPDRVLDRNNYEANLQALSYDPQLGTILTTLDPTGQVMLGWKVLGSESDYRPGHATIREVLNQILTHAGVTYTLPEEGLSSQVPWDARDNDSHLAALYAILKWCPDLCLRWTGTELALIRPDLENPEEIDPAEVLMQEGEWEEAEAVLCESVTIRYIRRRTIAPPFDITTDSATGGYPGARALVKDIYLESGEPPPEAGIAEEFLAWAGRLHINGRITLRGLNLARQVGDTHTIPPALGGLGDTPTVCQAITRNLVQKTHTLTMGVPRHLGLDDLIALKRKPRRPDPGDSEQPEESGDLEIAITGLPDGLDAKWSVGDQAGSGEATLTLAPGSYNVEFLPVYDFDTGTLYFAPSVSIELANEGTETATGAYEAVELAASNPFQIVDISAGETKKIKVRPSTIFEQDAVEVSELTVSASGFVWVAVPFTPSTGAVGTGTLSYGSTIPDATDSSYIVPIGAYTLSEGNLTVTNYRYGPITGFPCRDFYAEPVNWTLYIN